MRYTEKWSKKILLNEINDFVFELGIEEKIHSKYVYVRRGKRIVSSTCEHFAIKMLYFYLNLEQ